MNIYGVRIVERGAAIVGVQHGDDGLLATAIERHAFDLGVITARVHELDDGEARFVIDSEGLGSALWQVLGEPDDTDRWQLVTARGLERQALVDRLVVAVQEDRFHFASKLAERLAMTKALLSYRREVRDDGVIGSELVVALMLALIPPEPPKPILIAFGSGDGPPRFLSSETDS